MYPPPHTDQIAALAEVYRRYAKAELSNLREADCPVRIELDRVAAKAIAMPVSRLHEIRHRIAAEPSVAGYRAGSKD